MAKRSVTKSSQAQRFKRISRKLIAYKTLALSAAALFSPSSKAADTPHALTGATTNNWTTATFSNPSAAWSTTGIEGDFLTYNVTSGVVALDTLTLNADILLGGISRTNTGALTFASNGTNFFTFNGTGVSAINNPFGNANTAFISNTATGSLTLNTAINMASDLDLGVSTSATAGLSVTNAISATGGTRNLNLRSNNSGGFTLTAGIGGVGSTGIAVNNLGSGSGNVTLNGILGPNVSSVTQNAPNAALVISNNNTYSGDTTVSSGTLIIGGGTGSNTVFGVGGTLRLAGGAMRATVTAPTDSSSVYKIANPVNISADTTFTSGGATDMGINFQGATTLTGSRILNVLTNSGSINFSNTIGEDSSGRTLTKSGSGGMNLNGSNSFSGGVILNAGTLSLGNAAALGSGALVINGGALNSSVAGLVNANNNAVTVNGDFSFTGGQSLNLGSGAMTLGTASGTSRTITGNASTLTLAGVISDGTTANSLVKAGNGTLTLTGNNQFSGNLTHNAGTLNLFGNNNFAGTFTVNANAFLTGTNAYAGGTLLNSGTLRATSTSSTSLRELGTGTITGNGGTLELKADGGGGTGAKLFITGNGTTGNNLALNASMTLDVNNAINNGTITNGVFRFNNLSIGAHTLNISGANSYVAQFAGSTTLTGNATISNNTTAALSGPIGDGGNNYSLTKSGGITLYLAGDNTFGAGSTGTSLTQTAGTTSIGGSNAYTGATVIHSGGFNLGYAANAAGTVASSNGGGSIANSSNVIINQGVTVTLENSGGNTNRLKDAGEITFNQNARLALIGNQSTNTTETVGKLNFNGGTHVLSITQGGSLRVATLAADSIVRSDNATALLRATNSGQFITTTGVVTLSTAGVTALGQVGSTVATTGTKSSIKSLRIVPFMIGDTDPGASGISFVTYDTNSTGGAAGLEGLRALDRTNEFDNITNASSGYSTVGNNVLFSGTGGITFTAGPRTVNSFWSFGGSSPVISGAGGVNDTLTIWSGALAIQTSATATTITGFGKLIFGNEAIITTLANATTINSPIDVTNSGGLTKTGGNTLNLGNAGNLYTGTTTVNQGTLGLLNSNSLNGTTGTNVRLNFGTLSLGATTQTIKDLTFANNAGITGTSTINLAGNVAYDATGNGVGSTLTAGTINLNGTRTFSIGDSVNAATDLTIAAGISGAPSTTNAMIVTGAGNLAVNGVISDPASGSTSVTKTGTGTLSTSIVHTYSGPTTVSGGNFSISGGVTTNVGAANSDFTVNSGGTLTFISSGGTTGIKAKSVTLTGGTLVQSPGTDTIDNVSGVLSIASNANTLVRNINSNKNMILNFGSFSRAAGSTLLIRTDNTEGNKGRTVFAVAPSGSQLSNGALIGTFIGFGTANGAIAAEATDIGNYNSNVVAIASASSQGASASFTGNPATNYKFTGAVSHVATANTNSINLGAGSSINGAQTLNVTSGMILATADSNIGATTPGTLNFGSAEGIVYVNGQTGSGRTLTIGSTITGSNANNGLTFTGGINGAGTLILSGANTFTGDTILNTGTLRTDNALALQNSTLNYNNQGGSISFGALSAATVGGLKGSQSLALANASSAAVNLTVGSAGNSGSTTYAGVLSGAGSLTKDGAGTLSLTGASTYSGITTVKSGTLALTAATGNTNLAATSKFLVGTSSAESGATLNVASIAGGFQVKSGQTLAGHGQILGNEVTVNAGATLAPGNSIGTISLNNSLTLLGTSDYEVDSSISNPNAAAQDRTVGITTLNYGGSLKITDLANTGALTAGKTFDLFDFTSGHTGGFTNFTNSGSTGTASGGGNLPTLASGLGYSFDYSTGQLSITATHAATAVLASTAPAGYAHFTGTSNPSGTYDINVVGEDGSYEPGYLNNITGGNPKGYVSIGGITETEIIAIDFTVTDNLNGSLHNPSAAQVNALLDDLNASATGYTAVLVSSLDAATQSLFPNYEIAFLFATNPANPNFFGVDFSSETNYDIGGGVIITSVNVNNIAVVPEPTALLSIGAIGVMGLASRRRRRIHSK